EGRTYRLPTEAQWKYVYDNPGPVTNMGSREWVRDWHDEYPHNNLTDPTGPVKGMVKVIRDNGYNRWSLPPGVKYNPLQLPEAGPCGFRLVFEHDPPAKRDVLTGPFCQAAVKQSTAPALQGPDPAVPYFTVRFSMPIPPDNSDAGLASMLGCDPIVTAHNHSPGFDILPNGDALAVWFTGGSEYGPEVRFCQARLRYGSDQWDMPEILYDMKRMNDTSGMLWTEDDGTIRFFGGGRIDSDEKRPFVMATSTDNGQTWNLKRPVFPVPAINFTAQPVVDAWRQNGTTIYMVTDGGGSNSIVWRSTDNGVTWYDMGGRTNGRHSTIVPIGNSGTLLSYGGKNSDISGWMPWNKSYDWGATWPDEGASPFAVLNGNQRPCMERLANGKLVFVGDCQRKGDNYQPPGWSHGFGAFIAISDNNGVSWTFKKLPVTLPHESDREYGTIGYSTVRQAPSGVIHILTTMTHPCLHYELNEAWILSGDGDIPPETTGGTVNSYSENYPSGPLKATWSALTCPNGRYLLHDTETSYYEDGTTEHQVTYVNGRKSSIETFWGPDGTKLWSWDHNDSDNTSVWTHYWSNGLKRMESRWDTYPAPRDLPSRNFSGFVGDGAAYHWSLCGQPEKAYSFSDGSYLGETALPEPQAAIIADITGDCVVDGKDLKVLAGDWLETGDYVPTIPPNDVELILFYDFDESSGFTLADSSGNWNDGYLITDVNWTLGELSGHMDPGRSGNSFHSWPGLGTTGIYIWGNLFTKHNITQQITVALWISNEHPEETPDASTFMWEFRQWDGLSPDAGPRVLAVEAINQNSDFRFHDDSQTASLSVDWANHTEWTHYAFVRDAANLKLYVNGRLASQAASSGSPMAVPSLLYCGVSADRAPGNPSGLHDVFTGNMDDFKIYRYALSGDEVLHIAFDGNAYFPPDSP
ncbi:MAG: LamG-like jellyroll fold domain-containing protein, partial [Planctomycetota bacterium]